MNRPCMRTRTRPPLLCEDGRAAAGASPATRRMATSTHRPPRSQGGGRSGDGMIHGDTESLEVVQEVWKDVVPSSDPKSTLSNGVSAEQLLDILERRPEVAAQLSQNLAQKSTGGVLQADKR